MVRLSYCRPDTPRLRAGLGHLSIRTVRADVAGLGIAPAAQPNYGGKFAMKKIIAGLAAVAALAIVAGCGSSDAGKGRAVDRQTDSGSATASSGPSTAASSTSAAVTFDAQKMAADIQTSEQGKTLGTVTCPESEPVKKGTTFTCTAGNVDIKIMVTSDSGDYTWQPQQQADPTDSNGRLTSTAEWCTSYGVPLAASMADLDQNDAAGIASVDKAALAAMNKMPYNEALLHDLTTIGEFGPLAVFDINESVDDSEQYAKFLQAGVSLAQDCNAIS
jgi:hypothetical protein